jgi:glycosyltransferase involved in cell wall biosynthesis
MRRLSLLCIAKTTNMATIDIIIPCYNYGCFLRQAVESVLAQPLDGLRVLIIDDHSSDETPDVAAQLAREDARVASVRHDVNRGHIATYNEGIAWASGRYMLILSADDYLLPGALARAVSLMEAHEDVGFVFGRCIELYPATPLPAASHGEVPYRILSGLEFIETSGALDIVPTATAVVRTELQRRIGGYRPDLPHAGDMEMWLRFALQAKVGVIDGYQAVYRRHERNMSLAFNGGLADLRQRKKVFDSVSAAGGGMQPEFGALHGKLIRRLARDAVAFASETFNRGDLTECEQILEFAHDLWPQVKNTAHWRRVALKRRMGPKIWSIIHPLARELRRHGAG